MTDEPVEPLKPIQFPDDTLPRCPWLVGPLPRRGEMIYLRANERGEIVDLRPKELWDALLLARAKPEGTA
jgi:hypothetical protein